MSRQRPTHVVVEQRSGCGTVLAFVLLLGLTIEYWYIALAIVLIVVVVAIVGAIHKREAKRQKAAHRTGPRDPWLNEVAVEVADLGLTEIARNTGNQLGGARLEGDIGLQADRFLVYVNLFSDQRLARQAELGLRAKPEVRNAIATGSSAVRTEDRVVFTANGRGTVVDEFRLDDVVRVVGAIAMPPPLQSASIPALGSRGPAPDVLEQVQQLGDLRNAGLLTDAEFEAKKTELLGRL